MKTIKLLLNSGVAVLLLFTLTGHVMADLPGASCKDLPGWSDLKSALDSSDATDKAQHGGFGLQMWAAIVNRDGFVCAVAFTGADRGDMWAASRVIATQKSSTANSLATPPDANEHFPAGLALSTANLYASAQSGGSLFGVQFSNPVDTHSAYHGDPMLYGAENDPLVGHRMGGHNVFGGGFALYDDAGNIIGGLGVSGDTSCKDHNFGWRLRYELELDYVPAGVNAGNDPLRPDNIIYDMGKASEGNIESASGFGHVDCGLGEKAISANLAPVRIID